MIENKELGVKIAEDPVEAKWQRIEDNAKQAIENNKTEIEINEAILKLAQERLKEIRKGRAKYVG